MKPLTNIQGELYGKIQDKIREHNYSDYDIVMALAKLLNDYKKANRTLYNLKTEKKMDKEYADLNEVQRRNLWRDYKEEKNNDKI